MADLATYAQQGHLTPELEPWAQSLSPQQQQQLRNALRVALTVPPTTIDRFLRTPTGGYLLQRASQIIQSKHQGATPTLLHTALVRAAADPDGLTVVSLLRHFPDTDIQVDAAPGAGDGFSH